jgi:putative transcriptional regulator
MLDAIKTIAVLVALTIASMVGTAPVLAASSDTLVLVATPKLRDPFYGGTVLIAKPLEAGQHVGFILNRPTRLALSDVFPSHEPSRKVREPIYLGGPSDVNVVVALVEGRANPGDGSMQLAPDLYLAVTAKTVDEVIENASDHARFFAGAVVWQPGELDRELKLRAWYVMDLEPDMVLRKQTDNLWQELVQRAEMKAKGI